MVALTPPTLGLDDQPAGRSAERGSSREASSAADRFVARTNTILLVDDDPLMLDHSKYALEQTGHAVQTALSGEDALNVVSHDVPDIVVCDVAMPSMDGFEFMQRMRSRTATAAVPLIFLTAEASTQEAIRGLALGSYSAGFGGGW